MTEQYIIPGLSTVNVGLTPNDGTGNSLRDAFKITNQNIYELSRFLMLAPELPSVTVAGPIVGDSITTNVSTTVQGHITSTIESNTPDQGALTVVGGVGIGKNLCVGGSVFVEQNVNVNQDLSVVGTIYGDVEATTFTANTLGVTGDAIMGSNVVINGTLTVFGNISTVTTSEYIIQHPVIEIGQANTLQGNTATLTYNDGKDRGISFFWYDTVANTQQMGFMGFNNDSQKFIYIPRGTYTSGDGSDNDIFDGPLGDALFNTIEANIISHGTSQFSTLDVETLNVTTGGLSGNIQTSDQPNITSLGTLTGLTVVGNTSMTGNLTVTDGTLNITNGMLYINGDPVATSSQAFHGGNIYLDSVFSSGTVSNDPDSGACKVYGGLGVSGNVNVGLKVQAPSIVGTTITGTLVTANQPNITTVGNLGNLVVTGSVSGNSVSSATMNVSDRIYTDKLTVYNGITGTILTASQPNITSVGNLSSLTVVGALSASSFNGAVTGNVTGNLTGNVTGSVLTASQPYITSIGSLSSLNVTGAAGVGSLNAGSGVIQTTGNITTSGNVTGANLYGSIKTASQPTITTVGNLTSLAVTGLSSLTGAVTLGSSLFTTGAGTQSIGTATNRFGTIFSTAIDNATSILTGNLTATTGVHIISNGSGVTFPDGTVQYTAGVSGGGSVTYATTAGTVINQQNSATIQATTANIAGNIVLRDSSGSFSAGTVTAASFVGPLTGTVTGNVSGSSATVRNSSQPTITSLGTLTELAVTGNVTLSGETTLNGNLIVNGTTTTVNAATLDVADLNITIAKNAVNSAAANGAGLTVGGAGASMVYASLDDSWNFNKKVAGTVFYGSGAGLNNIPNSALSNYTVNVIAGSGLSGGANVQLGQSATISLPAVGTSISNQFVKISTDVQGRVSGTSAVQASDITGILGSTTVTNATNSTNSTNATNAANVFITDNNTNPAIVYPVWVTGTGNTAEYVSSTQLRFTPSTGVLYATATSARYADLAEKYQSDAEYGPGTVLVFGGSKEVTTTGHRADVSVAGVVSTAPAYLMNEDEPNSVAVALRGKVPVKVIGPVKKGDLLVTSYVQGFAESVGKDASFGVAVFAKSLEEDLTPGNKVINAVII